MSTRPGPLTIDRNLFVSLTETNITEIDLVLAPDFLLIDAIQGNEIRKSELLAALQSGALKFQSVEQADVRLRFYPGTAIITGRTRMSIRFQGAEMEVHSRYTHVYIVQHGYWRLITGQGTPISAT